METSKYKKTLASKNVSIIIVLIVVIVFFYIMNRNYLGKDNITSILSMMSISGTIAIGMACLLISGQISLAAGAEGFFGGTVVALLLAAGTPWLIAVIGALLFGVLAGLLTSYFVNVLNFMAFITTIAMQYIYKGLGLVLTNSQAVAISNLQFRAIGSSSILGIPTPFLIMVFLFIIYGLILNFTRFGRKIYICGGNVNAARLAGINPKKIHTILFVNCSTISAFAGIIMAARMHASAPNSVFGAEFDAITGAVLGGIAFTGGTGGMFGCFFGLLLLACFNNGMVVAGLHSYWSIVARGVLLISALSVDHFRERSRLKALKTS